jgi:adenylate cyclase
VAEELAVRYVLEGSVQKTKDRVRINAQLIDAVDGNHLWAERYDRELKDIFDLQDEITKKIITDLQVKLTEGEQARLLSRGANNLQAYLKWLEGLGYIGQFSREATISARRIGQEVIRLDPQDWRGYSLLAYVDLYDIWLGLSKSRQESLKSAMALAQKAQKIDPTQSDTYRLLAHAYILMRQNDTAIVKAELALEMEPGAANPHATLGHVLLLSRRHQEAIAMLEKAIRLNPYPPSWYFDNLAGGYRLTGRYEEAIVIYKKALEKAPNDQIALVGITAAYSLSGRLDEARAAAKNLLRANSKFSVEKYTQRGSPKEKSKDKSALTTAEALYKAGLK